MNVAFHFSDEFYEAILKIALMDEERLRRPGPIGACFFCGVLLKAAHNADCIWRVIHSSATKETPL